MSKVAILFLRGFGHRHPVRRDTVCKGAITCCTSTHRRSSILSVYTSHLEAAYSKRHVILANPRTLLVSRGLEMAQFLNLPKCLQSSNHDELGYRLFGWLIRRGHPPDIPNSGVIVKVTHEQEWTRAS